MNKLGLFFCFLLAICYVQTEVIDGLDINELYDKFTIIAKGMAETTEYKCSNALIKHKTTILPVVEDIMKSLKNEQELMNKLITASFKLLALQEFIEGCKINEVIQILPNLLKADGIKTMGQNMINNAGELENLFKEFTGASDIEGKNIAIGKIVRKITGLSFL